MRNSTLALILGILGILLIPFTASAGLPTWLGGKPAPTPAQLQVQQINTAVAQATSFCTPFSAGQLSAVSASIAAGDTGAAADAVDQMANVFDGCSGNQQYITNLLEASLILSDAQCNGNIIGRHWGIHTLREARATAYWQGVRSKDAEWQWQEAMKHYQEAADQRLASCTR
jgi:hypothetical protein